MKQSFRYLKVKTKNVEFISYSDLFMLLAFLFLIMYALSSLYNGVAFFNTKKENIIKQRKLGHLKDTMSLYNQKSKDGKALLSHKENRYISNIKKNISTLENNSEALGTMSSRISQINSKHQVEIKNIKNRFTELLKANTYLKKEVGDLYDVVSKYEKQLDSKSLEIKTVAKKLNKKNYEITNLLKTKNQYKSMLDKQNKRNQDLKKAHKNLAKEKVKSMNLSRNVKKLSMHNQKLENSLNQNNSFLEGIQKKLSEMQNQNSSLQSKLKKLQSEKKDLKNALSFNMEKLNKVYGDYDKISSELNKLNSERNSINKLKGKNEKLSKTMDQLNGNLGEAQKKIAKLSHKNNKLASNNKELSRGIASLRSTNEALNKKLGSAHKSISQYKGKISGLEAGIGERDALRAQIINNLKEGFGKSGINAKVNEKTGVVALSFGKYYFDYDSTVLKDGMKKELQSVFPTYIKSVFKNNDYAKNVASIEIIGTASPTFGKRKVKNTNTAKSDWERRAMSYNLDLSYKRARSIFDYLFQTNDVNFNNKADILPFIKMVGVGYLRTDEKLQKKPEDQREPDLGYCGMYDCLPAQKVYFKFNLK